MATKNIITNPGTKFYNLIAICENKLQSELVNIAKEQERLNQYKARNEDKIMQINAWQELINSRVDNVEYLQDSIIELFPQLFESEGQRRFLKGREFENNKNNKSSFLMNDKQKEAFRAQSITEQRIKDNI